MCGEEKYMTQFVFNMKSCPLITWFVYRHVPKPINSFSVNSFGTSTVHVAYLNMAKTIIVDLD